MLRLQKQSEIVGIAEMQQNKLYEIVEWYESQEYIGQIVIRIGNIIYQIDSNHILPNCGTPGRHMVRKLQSGEILVVE